MRRTPARFNPLSLPGCFFWVDAMKVGVAVADGVTLTAPLDLGPSHITMAVNFGGGPTYKMSQLNGRPCIHLNSDYYCPTAVAGSDNISTGTIFHVSRWSASTNNVVVAKMPNISNGAGWASTAGGRYLLLQQNGSTWAQFDTGVATDDSTWRIVCHRWTSFTAAATWWNGVAQSATNIGSGTVTTISNVVNPTIGNMYSTSAGTPNGDLAEVFVYNTALGTGQLNTVGQYLAAKWGLTWTNV